MSCVHSEYSVLIPPLAPVHSTSILSKKVHLFLLAARTPQHPAALSGLVCGLPLQIALQPLHPAHCPRRWVAWAGSLTPPILHSVWFSPLQTLPFVKSLFKKLVSSNSQFKSDIRFLPGPWLLSFPSAIYQPALFIALSLRIPYQVLSWINSYFPL